VSDDAPDLDFAVAADEAGRLDRILQRRFGASRRQLGRLFDDGHVRLDGKKADKGQSAAAGQRVTLATRPGGGPSLAPVAEPATALAVLFEDEALVAIDKPAGVASHPLRPGEGGTAANALVARFPECAMVGRDPREGGLCHRLDRGTSGVLVAARDRASWDAMRLRFGDGLIEKRYLALVVGRPAGDGLEAPIAQRGKRAAVVEAAIGDALPAETRWRVLEELGAYALVECEARTGRMHQIRAHLAAAGAPLVGDPTYGGPAALPELGDDADAAQPWPILHAARIGFAHPRSGAPIAIEAPLPAARAALLARLRAG
jgi:23S rRNA pseudouridine1911/1915/1917 synthase